MVVVGDLIACIFSAISDWSMEKRDRLQRENIVVLERDI